MTYDLFGAAPTGRFLKITLSVHSADAATFPPQTFKRTLLIRDAETQTLDDPENKPLVLAVDPYDEQNDVFPTDPILLRFTESVRGVSTDSIRLTDAEDRPLDLLLLDADLLPVDSADWLTQLTVVPTDALRFDSGYTVELSGLVDQSGDELVHFDADNQEQPGFNSSFRTRKTEPKPLNAGGTLQRASAGLQNLTFHLMPGTERGKGSLKLIVDDTSRDPKVTIAAVNLTAAAPYFPDIAVFAPGELNAPEGSEMQRLGHEPGAERYKVVPQGTVVVVTYWSAFSKNEHMQVLRYTNGSFETIYRMDLPGAGALGGVSHIGPYLLLGFYDLSPAGPVGYTEVVDMRDFVKRLKTLAAGAGTGLPLHRYREAWNNTQKTRYNHPRGAVDVTGFLRTDQQGRDLAFAVAGLVYPGVNNIVQRGNQPVAPVNSYYDTEAVIAAAYPVVDDRGDNAPGRYGGGNLLSGAVQGLQYRRGSDLVTRDLALFHERPPISDGGSYVHVYELPDRINLDQPSQPTLLLKSPDAGNMAVDRHFGLIALSTLENGRAVTKVWALQTLFDAVSEQLLDEDVPLPLEIDLNDPPNAGLVFWQVNHESLDDRDPFGEHLDFYHGRLRFSSRDAEEQVLHEVSLIPVNYRTKGWLTYDLATWQATEAEGGKDPLRYLPQGVLVATDLPDLGRPNDTGFHMETGSWGIELSKNESLQATLVGPGIDFAYQSGERQTAGMVTFNTAKLTQHLAEGDNAAELRRKGYLHLKWQYEITKNYRVIEKDEVAFLVVYRQAPTRYRDGNRTLGALDLLSRTPEFQHTDVPVPGIDPRLDLSPSRRYAWDYALGTGLYGVGMLDAQRVYASVPIWWRPALLPKDPGAIGDNTKPLIQLQLEQPGVFQVQGELNEALDQAAFYSDPFSSFNFSDDGGTAEWRLNHMGNVVYRVVGPRKFPDLFETFKQLNQGLTLAAEKPVGTMSGMDQRIMYPVVREAGSTEAPGSLFTALREHVRKDKPWENQYWANGRDAARYPNRIIDEPNDAGAARQVQRTYRQLPQGVVINSQRENGLEIDYTYDDAGYLTAAVVKAPAETRTTLYQWEALEDGEGKTVALGDFTLKRLKRVAQSLGGGNDQRLLELTYAAADHIAVSQVNYDLCDKAVTPTFDDTSGRVSAVSVADCDTFTPSVSFAAVDGLWLSSGWSPGGDFAFTTTWTRQALTAVQVPGEAAVVSDLPRFDWFMTADSYRAQRVAYNQQGLPTTTTSHKRSQTLTYMTAAARQTEPATLVDGGQTWRFSYPKTTERLATDSISRQSHTTYYSQSGVPIRSKGPDGVLVGSENTQNYLPIGGQSVVERDGAAFKPNGKDTLGTARFNRFGEVVGGTRLGSKQTVERDGLGRITATTLGNQSATFQHLTLGNRVVVASEDKASDTAWREAYDERGLLREVTVAKPIAATTRFTYDPLDRLVSVVRSEGPAVGTTRYSYFEDTDIVTRVTGPAGISQSQNVVIGDAGIEITRADATIAGQTDTVPINISADGLTVQHELGGVGTAVTQLDGFGRPTETGAGDTKQTTTYAEGETTTTDGFNGRTATLKVEDPYGIKQSISVKDQKTGDTRAASSEVTFDSTGMIAKTIQGGQERSVRVNGAGEIEEIRIGNRVVTLTDYHASGAPGSVSVGRDGVTGNTTAATEYDSHGRPISGTDPHGHAWSVTYNEKGQVATYTHPRGMVFDYAYHPELGILNRVSTNEANRTDSELVLFARGEGDSGLLSGTFGNWLGHQQQIGIDVGDNNKGVTLTETTTANSAKRNVTRSLRLEEGTGLPTQAEGPSGTTRFSHEAFGNKSEVTLPNGATVGRENDGFGGALRNTRNGLTQTQVRRDERGRIVGLRTPNREISLTYDKAADALARIDGLKEPIAFSNFNHLSQPGRADIGNGRLVMEMEYHGGGRLSCTTETRKGGLSTRRTYSSFGDLSSIQRGNQPAVSYSYNRWGGVASMRYKGQDYEVFGNGASGKLNFPGDVTADIDSKGRLIEVQRPGLALKELTYSDEDQLDQLFFGGQLLRDYDYRNGDLSEIRVVNANGPEDLYAYQYDEHGRLSTILENGAVLAAWTYPDPNNSAGQDPDQRFVDGERVLSYTDGNGVLHRYGYDAYGYTNRIDIEGGPTFHYRRDDAGNLLELQTSGMAVTYTDWQEGLPSTMTWGDGTRFSIDRNSNNNLQRIADDAEVFVLDLTWRPESASGDPCESGGTEDKQLTRVERKAGTFTEIIEPAYNSDEHLTGVTINRNSNGVTDQIQESYGTVQNQLLGGLTRLLNNQILVDEQLAVEAGADNRRIHQRIGATGATEPNGTDQYSYDPILGNLQQINRRDGTVRTFVWDGFRRLREIRDDNNLTAQYHYDHQYRRIRAATQHHPQPLAFAYEGSKVIAIGLYEGPGQVQWTHAIGQGPLGPAFIKDLTGAGMDYHIFSDHLGTPLAYKNANTGTIYINPRSPWGESLANTPTRGSPYTTQNFSLPPDPIFPTTPLGLSGHLQDADTGLTYMHHRFYDPRLGHFLNPDFRAPDIYDPTTFTEPYAFAAGNPMMFWDPDGLHSKLAFSLFEVDMKSLENELGENEAKITLSKIIILEEMYAKFRRDGRLHYQEIVLSRVLLGELTALFHDDAIDFQSTSGVMPVRLVAMPTPLTNFVVRKSSVPVINGLPTPTASNPANPLNSGFFREVIDGSDTPTQHVFNFDPQPKTRFISASEHPNGSNLQGGKKFRINAKNIKIISNKELVILAVQELVDGKAHFTEGMLKDWMEIQKPVSNLSSEIRGQIPDSILIANDKIRDIEFEVLISDDVSPGDIETKGLRYAKRLARGTQFLGYAFSAYELGLARDRAIRRNSYKPYAGWAIRETTAFGFGAAGAYAGATYGGSVGFIGGPGGAIAGGLVFGVAGGFLGDAIADQIDKN
ncbi:RHS repeat-associated core domain-containing protein [Acanthopleuribacter pedis]